jgi:hypothetical protein
MRVDDHVRHYRLIVMQAGAPGQSSFYDSATVHAVWLSRHSCREPLLAISMHWIVAEDACGTTTIAREPLIAISIRIKLSSDPPTTS